MRCPWKECNINHGTMKEAAEYHDERGELRQRRDTPPPPKKPYKFKPRTNSQARAAKKWSINEFMNLE